MVLRHADKGNCPRSPVAGFEVRRPPAASALQY